VPTGFQTKSRKIFPLRREKKRARGNGGGFETTKETREKNTSSLSGLRRRTAQDPLKPPWRTKEKLEGERRPGDKNEEEQKKKKTLAPQESDRFGGGNIQGSSARNLFSGGKVS